MSEKRNQNNTSLGIGHMILRIVVSAVVLAVVAFFTPGFTIENAWSLILAAAVIGVLDYLIERVTGFDASPFGRGITGFIVSAVIIYATGYLIRGVGVTFWGAIIAALVIGIINMILPGRKVL
jgi:putative membrane protein